MEIFFQLRILVQKLSRKFLWFQDSGDFKIWCSVRTTYRSRKEFWFL